MIKFSLIFLVSLILPIALKAVTPDLDDIRNRYRKAAADKEICADMLKDLRPLESQSVYLAYLGGVQTIWARHVFNPFAKFNTFRQGRALIEKAVANSPEHIEIRFIRLSVQKNAPAFLRYNRNIREDEMFLRQHITSIRSLVLLQMIRDLLEEPLNSGKLK